MRFKGGPSGRQRLTATINDHSGPTHLNVNQRFAFKTFGANPLLNTLLIIGANGFCVLVCYVLGYRKGIRNVTSARDLRRCICEHRANSHKAKRTGWGKCEVYLSGDQPCACNVYIPEPIDVSL